MRTATSSKSFALVVMRNTAEPLVGDDCGPGDVPSGTPDHPLPFRLNSEPLVTIQSAACTALGALGFHVAYSLVTSRLVPVGAKEPRKTTGPSFGGGPLGTAMWVPPPHDASRSAPAARRGAAARRPRRGNRARRGRHEGTGEYRPQRPRVLSARVLSRGSGPAGDVRPRPR